MIDKASRAQVDPAVPDWDLAPVHTHHTPCLLEPPNGYIFQTSTKDLYSGHPV